MRSLIKRRPELQNRQRVPKRSQVVMESFAFKAAVAALAADRQGKFWEFHDELFKNHKNLNEKKIEEIASQLKLNQAKFEKDRKVISFYYVVEIPRCKLYCWLRL